MSISVLEVLKGLGDGDTRGGVAARLRMGDTVVFALGMLASGMSEIAGGSAVSISALEEVLKGLGDGDTRGGRAARLRMEEEMLCASFECTG